MASTVLPLSFVTSPIQKAQFGRRNVAGRHASCPITIEIWRQEFADRILCQEISYYHSRIAAALAGLNGTF
jgi:hypothetical protein